MLRLTLLCHGATAATRAAAFPADEPLEPRAVEATRSLRGAFAPDLTLTSPALRARQTAEALGLGARVEPALADLDGGRWAGTAMATLLEREPEAFAAFMTDPLAGPHGGESVAALAARAEAWLATLAASHGSLLAVTHAAVVRAAVLTVLSAPLAGFWRIDVPPLSATDLAFDGRRWAWRAARLRAPAAHR